MFSVYGRFAALPGRRAELVEVLTEGLRVSSGAGGLLGYCVSEVPGEPDGVWLTQLWASREAHDAVTRSAAVVAVSGRVGPLLAGPPEGTYGTVVELFPAAAD